MLPAQPSLLIQRRLLDAQPETAMALFNAFEQSKRVAYERDRNPAFLYFNDGDFAGQSAVYGDDPYPLGLAAMRKTLERAVQGSLEQGLVRSPVNIDDLYHPTTLRT